MNKSLKIKINFLFEESLKLNNYFIESKTLAKLISDLRERYVFSILLCIK